MRSTQQLIPAIELITAINNLSRIAGKEKSIESIKVVKGRPDHLLVTVKSVSGDRTGDANRKQKSEVRIDFFEKYMHVDVENIPGTMQFLVSIASLRSNDLIIQNTCHYVHKKLMGAIEEISIFAEGAPNPIGKMKISGSIRETMTLVNFEMDDKHRGLGYDIRLMDYMFELCLQRGSHLKINVQQKQSEEDNPSGFYSKVCDDKKIKFHTEHDSININLCDLIVAIDGIDVREYNWQPHQYLACERFNLTVEQVKNANFTPIHYRAMAMVGLKDADLNTVHHYVIETALECSIDINLIKDFKLEQRLCLDGVLRYGKHKNAYNDDAKPVLIEFIRKAGIISTYSHLIVRSFIQDMLIRQLTLEQLKNGEAEELLQWLNNLTWPRDRILDYIRYDEFMDKSTRQKLSTLTSEQVDILKESYRRRANIIGEDGIDFSPNSDSNKLTMHEVAALLAPNKDEMTSACHAQSESITTYANNSLFKFSQTGNRAAMLVREDQPAVLLTTSPVVKNVQ